MSEQAVEVPLVEMLLSVPEDSREMIEISPISHRNIPYGRYCHESANRIMELEKKLAFAVDGLELVETVWRQTKTMDSTTMKIVEERLAQINGEQ